MLDRLTFDPDPGSERDRRKRDEAADRARRACSRCVRHAKRPRDACGVK